MGFPLGWMGGNGQVRGAEGFMQCVCNGAEGDLCTLCIGGVLRGSCTMCVCRGVVRAVQRLECVWSGVLGGHAVFAWWMCGRWGVRVFLQCLGSV